MRRAYTRRAVGPNTAESERGRKDECRGPIADSEWQARMSKHERTIWTGREEGCGWQVEKMNDAIIFKASARGRL